MTIAQEPAVLHGRVMDATGSGVRAIVMVRPATHPDSILGKDTSRADGVFVVSLAGLPAVIRVEAIVEGGIRAQLSLDSAAVRASETRPVVLRIGRAQEIAPVEVRARYQRRPSVFNYFSTDPTTRADPLGTTASYYDPMSLGGLDALLSASPDLLVSPDGTFSALGAPGDANQLQIDGVQMPASMGTGLVNGTLSLSPWDASIGGAAGATLNLFIRGAGRFRSTYAIVRTGASGVPSPAGSAEQGSRVSIPVKGWLETTGPIGSAAYRVGGFLGVEYTPVRQWDALLDDAARMLLDSLSTIVSASRIRDSELRREGGVLGRIDFAPANPRRVLALSAALTRTETESGASGGFATGSAGVETSEDAGFLKLEASRVLHQRVLWTAILSGAFSDQSVDRLTSAPGVWVSDTALGHVFFTGGSPPSPTSGTRSLEARSTWTWYSTNNRIRYLGQLQTRFEHAHVGPLAAHSTFTVPSIEALRTGAAIGLVRTEAGDAAHARSFVVAPAMTARVEAGRRGAVLLGIRADAWRVTGVAASENLRAIDVSPRIGFSRQLGRRRGGGPVATLRMGAGRFTNWPHVRSWSDAWSGVKRSVERCAGANVPIVDLTVPAADCPSGGAVQSLGGVHASDNFRPTAANRADLSVAFTEIFPGVRAELGVAAARTTRITGRRSPFAGAPIIDSLHGESERALLVAIDSIGADGVVPVAEISGGLPAVESLVSHGSTQAVQWRLRLATRDPFARLKVDATYVLTTGRERSFAIASPGGRPGLVSGPLSAGGRHTVAISLGAWLGPAEVRLSAMVRSGVRFTPLADRDLNGDGWVNDAAFVPASEAQSWASVVAPHLRDCVLDASGRIAGMNSCTGPWSVWSLLHASVPGAELGLPRGSIVDLQVSNPLGILAGASEHPSLVFGPQAPVDPTLVHITGFQPVNARFDGNPLARFGTPVGVASGSSAPIRFAVSVRIPFGPSITGQRADAALALLESDTSSRVHERAATTFLSDLPPLPVLVLQSGDAASLTTEQREALQAMARRWSATANRLFVEATGDTAAMNGGAGSTRDRLIRSRTDFVIEVQAIAAEIRSNLTPDQVDVLPEGIRRFLSPRFLRYLAALDSGEF